MAGVGWRKRGQRGAQPGQAEARITRQKLTGVKFGSLSASTSALTVPKVVSRLAVEAVVEGLDDLFLEMAGARVRADHRFALGLGELGKGDAEHVHLDAGGDERDDGMHVPRDAGRRVQRDRGPHRLDVLLGDAMAPEEITGDIGAVHLEALIPASVLRGQAHVVEHGAGIKELAIETLAASPACHRSPVKDAARVVEQQRRLGIPDQFGHLTRQLAVGHGNIRYRAGRRIG